MEKQEKLSEIEELSEWSCGFCEDYGTKLTAKKNGFREWADAENTALISEDSLQRTLSQMQDKSFAILTAYRAKFSKKENIVRNRRLRAALDKHRMGVHSLIGHWREAPDGAEYSSTPENQLVDTVERSYCVVKPEGMSDREFFSIVAPLAEIGGETQDAVVFRLVEIDPSIQLYFPMSDSFKSLETGKNSIGSQVTLGKIGQAYSQHVEGGQPFVFEGEEIPGTNFGKQAARKAGFRWGV